MPTGPLVHGLQRKCEAALDSIESHERSKTTAATAHGLGLVSTASIAVAVLATIGSLAAPLLVLPFAITRELETG